MAKFGQPDKGTYTSCSELKRPTIHQTAGTKDNGVTEERVINSLVSEPYDMLRFYPDLHVLSFSSAYMLAIIGHCHLKQNYENK